MASQMQAVRIAVQASVALAVLASGAVQAAPDKELPPQPGVADVIKESTAADVPAPERSLFEVMRTESATFQSGRGAAQPRRTVDQGRGRPRRPVRGADSGARAEIRAPRKRWRHGVIIAA
jgi:hypothetical protein